MGFAYGGRKRNGIYRINLKLALSAVYSGLTRVPTRMQFLRAMSHSLDAHTDSFQLAPAASDDDDDDIDAAPAEPAHTSSSATSTSGGRWKWWIWKCRPWNCRTENTVLTKITLVFSVVRFCNFMPYKFGPSFSCPSFSVNPTSAVGEDVSSSRSGTRHLAANRGSAVCGNCAVVFIYIFISPNMVAQN